MDYAIRRKYAVFTQTKGDDPRGAGGADGGFASDRIQMGI